MARKRITQRPNKVSGAFGIIWGGLFVLMGLVVVIPTFGAIGILWTLAALAITCLNGYRAFGKKYIGPEIYIEDEAEGEKPSGPSVEQRLEKLRDLYDRSLITEEEYEAKKQEILKDL